MCSGIAASLHLAARLDPRRPKSDLLATTLLINAGRITGYVVAGTIGRRRGIRHLGAFDHSTGHAGCAGQRPRRSAGSAFPCSRSYRSRPCSTGWTRMQPLHGHHRTRRTVAGIDGAVPRRHGLGLSSLRHGVCRPLLRDDFRFRARRRHRGGGFGIGTLPVLIGTGLGFPLLAAGQPRCGCATRSALPSSWSERRQRRRYANEFCGVVPVRLMRARGWPKWPGRTKALARAPVRVEILPSEATILSVQPLGAESWPIKSAPRMEFAVRRTKPIL